MAGDVVRFSEQFGSTGATNYAPERSASLLTVMVVDDQRTMRMLLRRGLRECGITEVMEATSGRDALEQLEDEMLPTPDIILSDLIMEDMDGLQLLQKVRLAKSQRIKDLPVVVLTGMDDRLVLDIARELGAACVLQKPIAMPKLAETIGRLIGVAITPCTC